MGLDSYLGGKNSDGSLTEVAYWRKANAIHGWFVNNVQNGVDKCQKSPVTRQQLNELLSVCHEVIKSAKLIDGHVSNGSHASAETNFKMVEDYIEGKVIENPEVLETLLPTVKGFFFGGYGYDEYYLSDVKNTVNQLQKALVLEFQEFVYQSSW